RIPGVWGSMLCRKRYGDDRVIQAVDAGVEQVVILGAGLDTRSYRLAAQAGIPAFEVDMPANTAYKQERLRAVFGRMPDQVALVAVDFETDDLAAALATYGFRTDQPTIFVWEGVTQYLTEGSVRKTLGFLSKAASRSLLFFTYVRKDFLDGINFYGMEKAYQDFVVKQQLWRYGIEPDKVADLLREYGWVEREHIGRAEVVRWYIQPSCRDLAVSEIERIVYAEKA
ncbi:MAG: SAM-dependent methyltransferase, partial [Chloroflexota bacterium]